MEEKREFEIVLEVQDDGGYVVSVPDLPGLWAQGKRESNGRGDSVERGHDRLQNRERRRLQGHLPTVLQEPWTSRSIRPVNVETPDDRDAVRIVAGRNDYLIP